MIKNKYKCECGFLIYSYGAFMIKNFQKWVYMEWVFFFCLKPKKLSQSAQNTLLL